MSDKSKSDMELGTLNLPAEDMPEDWDDDERMDFLFSAFKDRSINPISYDAKINFWKNNIQKICIHNRILCVDESKIRKIFERKSKHPACMLKVLEALKGDGKLVLKNDLTKLGYKGQSWAAWTTENVLAKPTTFAVGKLWSALGYEQASQLSPLDKFVCIDALKIGAEVLLSKYITDPDCIHSTSEALELSSVFKQENNKEDTELCIIWLCKNNKACVDETVNPALVKFGHNAKITDVDKNTLMLKKQEIILKRKLHELEEEKNKYVEEAKEYLKKNMRLAAKSSLRKKHEVEKRIEKLVDAMTNLALLTSHVEDTESNAKVIESYKSAAAALKSTFKETGLSEDSVANTMDEIGEALDLHDDVKTMISQPMGPIISSGDEDYEKELEDLLAEPQEPSGGGDGGGTESEFSFSDLPEVPTTSLASSIKTAL